MKQRTLARVLHGVGLAAALAFALFPFYWMVSSSLKDQVDLLASPPVIASRSLPGGVQATERTATGCGRLWARMGTCRLSR